MLYAFITLYSETFSVNTLIASTASPSSSGKVFIISHKSINVIQRMFPLVTVFSVFEKGKILHIPRYEKEFRIGFLYKGNPDKSILYPWFDKFIEHFSSTSLGIYPVNCAKEIRKCISF